MIKTMEKKILKKINGLEKDFQFIKLFIISYGNGVETQSKINLQPSKKLIQEAKEAIFDFDIEKYINKKQIKLWK